MNPFSIDAGSADFQEKVLDASHRTLVLVDFWAEWCAPCRALKPVLERLAVDYGGRILLAKVDSDRNPELAARYGVRGIPCVKAFAGGEAVDEFTGALPEAQIRRFIDALLPSPAEPLREAARAARANGEHEVACSLLDDAARLDPANPEVRLDLAELQLDLQRLTDAQATLDACLIEPGRHPRKDALLARLKLAAAAGNQNPAQFEARIAADPDDLDARLRLAGVLALAKDYPSALEQLLEVVRRDRKWNDEAARRTMLDLFTLLGGDARYDDLVRDFRLRLARTLN